MGALFAKAYAENELNSMISTAVTISNTATQNCQLSGTEMIYFQFYNQTGNIIIANNDFNQLIGINSTCMSNANFSSTIQSEIESSLQQQAQSLVGALSLGSAQAINLINATIQLSQVITNTFLQTCQANASAVTNIYSKDGNGNIYIVFNTIDQYITATQNCVQNAVANSAAASTIKQIIAQSAVAQAEGLLDALAKLLAPILAVLVIIVVIFLILAITKPSKFGGGQPKSGTKTVIEIAPTPSASSSSAVDAKA